MLEPFGPDLWLSDGPVVTGAAGFRFPTRMAIVRLPDGGGLWVWSPVALTNALRAKVETLGPVRHIVAPNSLHHLFVAEWSKVWPEAQIHAAPGCQALGVDASTPLSDVPCPAWAGVLEQVVVPGNRITTEVVFFHRPSATVLVTDLVQQLPRDWYHGWRKLVARLDLMSAPVPSVPQKFRLATTDRKAAGAAVVHILNWSAERLVMAHGAPVKSGAREVLSAAFDWLRPHISEA